MPFKFLSSHAFKHVKFSTVSKSNTLKIYKNIKNIK